MIRQNYLSFRRSPQLKFETFISAKQFNQPSGRNLLKYRSRLMAHNRLMNILNELHRRFIEPLATDEDSRRQEFVINAIVCGIALITSIKILIALLHDFDLGFDQEENSLIINGLVLLFSFSIWKINRSQYDHLAAYLLLILIGFGAFRATLNWSFEYPIAELMYAVLIVTAGVLLNARAALFISAMVSLAIILVGYGQIHGYLHPQTQWTIKDFKETDAFSYTSIMLVIAGITWLTNREIKSSLAKARSSEAALVFEKENLEFSLINRTRQLIESQKQHYEIVEHLADFGRINASLIHEIANPLAAATINLQSLKGQKNENVIQASDNLQQLNRYINATRQQLKHHGIVKKFCINDELDALALILNPLANKHQIDIKFEIHHRYFIIGDSVKFSQLIANLVTNSIDSYGKLDNSLPDRLILVSIYQKLEWLYVIVSDNGSGISPEIADNIFDPFFSTKIGSERGTGIGLSMVKQTVENDFSGSISLISSVNSGTQFTIKLKR